MRRLWKGKIADQIVGDGEEFVCRVISMFAGRVTFDRVNSLIKFLVDGGMSESTLLAACDNNQFIVNFPRAIIRKEAVLKYFKFYGETLQHYVH